MPVRNLVRHIRALRTLAKELQHLLMELRGLTEVLLALALTVVGALTIVGWVLGHALTPSLPSSSDPSRLEAAVGDQDRRPCKP